MRTRCSRPRTSSSSGAAARRSCCSAARTGCSQSTRKNSRSRSRHASLRSMRRSTNTSWRRRITCWPCTSGSARWWTPAARGRASTFRPREDFMSTEQPTPDYRLDHVCLAVRKLAPARDMLEKMLGYRARTEPVENTRQQVVVQFMSKAGSIDIKLIEPSSFESPLVEFLKRSGGGLHHLAFRTQSVEAGVADLGAKGAKIVA